MKDEGKLKILWLCGLPREVERSELGGEAHGACAEWPWILAHLPPPAEIELHVACLWPGGDREKTFEARGAIWHLVPCPRKGRAMSLFMFDAYRVRPLVSRLKPDIVHGWGTEDSNSLVAVSLAPDRHVVGVQGLIAEYRRRIPMHSRTLLTAWTERLTLAKARHVVAESAYSANAVRPLCPRAQISVVEHPLRPEFLGSAATAAAQSRRIVFVGTIDQRKGVFDAVRAFAAATGPEWALTIVGRGSHKNERRMNAVIQECGLADRVSHIPNLPSAGVQQAMAESAIFLLPTRIDTGPTALKEALTLGLWPVCYDNSGPGEYIRKFRFGSLAIDGDQGDLAKCLGRAVAERPWQREGARQRVHEEALQAFSPALAWERLVGVYRQIVFCAAS